MAGLAAQSIGLALGVSSFVSILCERIKVPALLPLLGVGLLLGRSGAGVVDGSSLGETLKAFITVAIGLLIFEGTLHLNREELGRSPRAVWGLLTVGALITWVGSAALAHFILDFGLAASVLLGAALIVTGPTVVQPILRRMHVAPRLNTALGAEAVFIDPIGVVATIASLEVVRIGAQTGFRADMFSDAAWLYLKPLIGGAGVGIVMGLVSAKILKAIGAKTRVEPRKLNLYAVGVCMTTVGVGEAIAPEAGLAAVTIAGVYIAQTRVIGAAEVKAFKELLATMLVGTLFILLASRFDASQLASLTARDALFVAALILLVRPACVVLSTIRSKLTPKERAFASLFAPRGIVALSVAAVAAAELTELLAHHAGDAPPWFSKLALDATRLELVMFTCIAGTVLWASAVGPLLARALGVRAGRGNGVLIIGAHPLGIAFAKQLADASIPVKLIDTNTDRIAAAAAAGLHTLKGDATDTRWLDDVGAHHEFGWLVAWTGNNTVNQVAARWAEDRFGPARAGIWSSGGVKPEWRRMELGRDRLLDNAVDHAAANPASLAAAAEPAHLATTLGWVEKGRFSLALPDAKPPKPAEAVVFIGIGAPAASTAPKPPPSDR